MLRVFAIYCFYLAFAHLQADTVYSVKAARSTDVSIVQYINVKIDNATAKKNSLRGVISLVILCIRNKSLCRYVFPVARLRHEATNYGERKIQRNRDKIFQ